MHRALLELTLIIVVLAGGVTTVVQAEHPPRPGTDDNGLTENQTATLWSNEPNTCRSDQTDEDESGTEQTAIHALASCTDLTFAEPPATAATWTVYDFQSLEPGESDTAVYPEHADLEDSGTIRDAHATIFAVQPSTLAHRDTNHPSLYVAPEGEIRGFVDYRVRVPDDEVTDNRTVEWSLRSHGVREVRLRQDGTQRTATAGHQTPVLEYRLDGSGPSTLTLEADIEVELEKRVTDRSGNETETHSETRRDSVTVSDDLDVRVYDLTAVIYEATYPDGDTGLAVYHSQPWHGYVLSEADSEVTAEAEDVRVRGVWRYYTARDTNWDHLVRAGQSREEVVHSDALPVYVHAYPSKIGPRVEPVRNGPELLDVWGVESPSPAATMHENVAVGVVDEPYTRSYGLAVRTATFDRDEFAVQGIVRGETADVTEPDEGSTREIRESELTATITNQTTREATIRITLRDAGTGEPVVLEGPFEEQPRLAPIGGQQRKGYLTIDGERVVTNASGVATVTVSEPGLYTAEYHPGSWRTHNPAYTGDQASVGWHPLSTGRGWLSLLVAVIRYSIPFLVALYAGRKLGTFLRFPAGESR